MVEEEELQIIERDIILTEGKQIYMEKTRKIYKDQKTLDSFVVS